MNSDRVIEAAISTAKNLLSQNLQSAHNLPDAATVTRLRELIHSPSVRSALQSSSDTFPLFALRALEFAAADQSLTDREIINRLWDALDDPHLNEALGFPRNSRMTLGAVLSIQGGAWDKTEFWLIAVSNNFLVARAAYDAAVKYNPRERWLLRDGIRVIERYEPHPHHFQDLETNAFKCDHDYCHQSGERGFAEAMRLVPNWYLDIEKRPDAGVVQW